MTNTEALVTRDEFSNKIYVNGGISLAADIPLANAYSISSEIENTSGKRIDFVNFLVTDKSSWPLYTVAYLKGGKKLSIEKTTESIIPAGTTTIYTYGYRISLPDQLLENNPAPFEVMINIADAPNGLILSITEAQIQNHKEGIEKAISK